MGKRSRERMTGKTEEERIAVPKKFRYKYDNSFVEEQKARKKEGLVMKYYRALMRSGKIRPSDVVISSGRELRVKRKVET